MAPIVATTSLEIIPLWINGKAVTGSESSKFPVISAAQEGKMCISHILQRLAQAIAACDSVKNAFQTWKDVSAIERRDIFIRASEILLSRREDFVKSQIEETSASEAWANTNVTLAASHMKEIGSRITSLSGLLPQSKLEYAMAYRVPVGPTLAIPPWNAPLVLGTRALLNPIGAGCTVVLKASELSPKTHHMLVQTLFDAGLPKDVVSIVQADRSNAAAVTEALIGHKAIRKVEFIGSAIVGRIIGSLAGKYLKPVLMELGGKCPAIVLEDAMLEDAVLKITTGAFHHHGQVCFSTERVFVVKEVADRFIELFKAQATEFPAGGAVSAQGAETALAKLRDAESKGAKFLLRKPAYDNKSAASLVKSIITNVSKDIDLFDEESFGPSVAIFVVENEDEAVRLANASDYGLVGAVHTQNLHRGLQIAKKLEIGVVHVNGATAYDESTLPMGGMKNSGWGRTNGSAGLEEFTQLQMVTATMQPGLPKW